MLGEVLEWRQEDGNKAVEAWNPKIALKNVGVTSAGIHDVPVSVARLRAAFEHAYEQGNWKALSRCLHPDYEGSLFEETCGDELVEAIRSWHEDSGGKGSFLADVQLVAYELRDDGKIWWHADLNIRSARPGKLARFPEQIWLYLVGLQDKQARIMAASR